MKIFLFTIFIVCLVTIIAPIEIFADTALDVYMNDFYSKSNEASKILKEIEGANPPMQAIKASQQRWESILNEG